MLPSRAEQNFYFASLERKMHDEEMAELIRMAQDLRFGADALLDELEHDPSQTQVARAQRVLGKSRELLQYAKDVRALENRRTMPITNSRAGTNTIGYVPRDRTAPKVCNIQVTM